MIKVPINVYKLTDFLNENNIIEGQVFQVQEIEPKAKFINEKEMVLTSTKIITNAKVKDINLITNKPFEPKINVQFYNLSSELPLEKCVCILNNEIKLGIIGGYYILCPNEPDSIYNDSITRYLPNYMSKENYEKIEAFIMKQTDEIFMRLFKYEKPNLLYKLRNVDGVESFNKFIEEISNTLTLFNINK